MAMVVIMVIISQESLIGMTYLMPAFIIMIGAIRQDTFATEELFHGGLLSQFIYGKGQEISCPLAYI
jgi:hypothetical protein